MESYKITVCRFGHVMVMADSEEDAKRKGYKLSLEQIQWIKTGEKEPLFLIIYIENGTEEIKS